MSELLKHPGESQNDTLSPEGKAAAHTRRTFLFKFAVGLNAAVGAVLAVPLIGYLLGPAMKKDKDTGSWINLGATKDFPEGEPGWPTSSARSRRSETARPRSLPAGYGISRGTNSRSSQSTARTSVALCTGLRSQSSSSVPATAATYYETGERASGPPERGLFEYRFKVVGDSLVIHAGDMPTLATQASCGKKPLVNITPATADARSPWQA